MRVIYNRLIPFKGLFGVLLVREGCTMTATDYNHEGEADYLKTRKKFNQYKKD